MPSDVADTPLPPTLQRRLPTLGHGLHRVAEAWTLLGRRLERGLLDEASTAWIQTWCGEALQRPLPLPVDSDRALSIVWAGKAWQVTGLATEGPWAAALLLLHLPVLRDFWRRALRTQRQALLENILPRAWALDPQPLRPGAVIAGLSLPTWADLPRLLAVGRSFELLSATITGTPTAPQPVEADSWPAALETATTQRRLIAELPTLTPEGRLRAQWQHDNTGRIVLGEVTMG